MTTDDLRRSQLDQLQAAADGGDGAQAELFGAALASGTIGS
jgi:hypothetical protein